MLLRHRQQQIQVHAPWQRWASRASRASQQTTTLLVATSYSQLGQPPLLQLCFVVGRRQSTPLLLRPTENR